MDVRFDEIFTRPENEIFRVVFYPDRIYHARILNATVSDRYRYDVDEVRTKGAFTVMKGFVYLDGETLTPFLRLEYRADRLLEAMREKNRQLGSKLIAWAELSGRTGAPAPAEAQLPLTYCRRIDAHQVEIWGTTEAPARSRHALRVLSQMGADGAILTVPAFAPFLADIEQIDRLSLAAREPEVDMPLGYAVADADAAWDNNYLRSIQVPNSAEPSSLVNTVETKNYGVDFQRGFFLQADEVAPVRYRNAMMNDTDPERRDDNITDMRWLLQQELGGDLIFFHEVTIPPGVVEGTHRHIGSEELYYIVRGEGLAYMGVDDDPELANLPVVERQIFGLEPRPCRQVPVRRGSVIFTKSGGIHGIENTGAEDLVFVAFLYHGS